MSWQRTRKQLNNNSSTLLFLNFVKTQSREAFPLVIVASTTMKSSAIRPALWPCSSFVHVEVLSGDEHLNISQNSYEFHDVT